VLVELRALSTAFARITSLYFVQRFVYVPPFQLRALLLLFCFDRRPRTRPGVGSDLVVTCYVLSTCSPKRFFFDRFFFHVSSKKPQKTFPLKESDPWRPFPNERFSAPFFHSYYDRSSDHFPTPVPPAVYVRRSLARRRPPRSHLVPPRSDLPPACSDGYSHRHPPVISSLILFPLDSSHVVVFLSILLPRRILSFLPYDWVSVWESHSRKTFKTCSRHNGWAFFDRFFLSPPFALWVCRCEFSYLSPRVRP